MTTTPQPAARNLADLYHLAPLHWDDVRAVMETDLTQAPGSGGPDRHTFWLSTVDADGRPHVTGVGAFWTGGRYCFTGGPRSRKIRNIERDPRCALAVAAPGYDLVVEGRAARVTDEAALRGIATAFARGGWSPTVADGGFTHEYSAPSAGPPPWHVYGLTPEAVYATKTTGPSGATRWTFTHSG
ncbi:MAG: pyridoxamine 5'-phosphate oxidase family protein [Acidimicrobiales bacterium]